MINLGNEISIECLAHNNTVKQTNVSKFAVPEARPLPNKFVNVPQSSNTTSSTTSTSSTITTTSLQNDATSIFYTPKISSFSGLYDFLKRATTLSNNDCDSDTSPKSNPIAKNQIVVNTMEYHCLKKYWILNWCQSNQSLLSSLQQLNILASHDLRLDSKFEKTENSTHSNTSTNTDAKNEERIYIIDGATRQVKKCTNSLRDIPVTSNLKYAPHAEWNYITNKNKTRKKQIAFVLVVYDHDFNNASPSTDTNDADSDDNGTITSVAAMFSFEFPFQISKFKESQQSMMGTCLLFP